MSAAVRADAAMPLGVTRPAHPIGFTRPWAEMSIAEREAFQHEYTRHREGLGLPNWKNLDAERLRRILNSVADYIVENANFVEVVPRKVAPRSAPFKISGGNQMQDVAQYYAEIHGTRYYTYSTLGGRFVSAGQAH